MRPCCVLEDCAGGAAAASCVRHIVVSLGSSQVKVSQQHMGKRVYEKMDHILSASSTPQHNWVHMFVCVSVCVLEPRVMC